MKLHLAALLVAVAVTLSGPGAGRVRAQVIMSTHSQVTWSGPASTAMPFVGGGVLDVGARFPYSYYAAFPNPARQYVPYGPLDTFPFYGSPYGKPYDRWTWDYLAGPPNALQRYYYPPLR